MEENTKENGDKEEPTERVSSGTLMETYMREIGRMTKQMVMDFISMPMELNILENGRMICSMDMDRRPGLMVQSMKESIGKVASMVKVNTLG